MKKTCRFSPFCVLECLSTLFRIRCHLCRLFISLVYKPLSYCAKVWICNKKWQFKMLVVLSSIFVADTKTTFGYNFVAPLNYLKVLTNSYYSIGLVNVILVITCLGGWFGINCPSAISKFSNITMLICPKNRPNQICDYWLITPIETNTL